MADEQFKELLLECEGLQFEGIRFSKLEEMPKIDLHRHLAGAVRPEVIVRMAERLNTPIPSFGHDIERIIKTSILTSTLGSDGYSVFLRKRIWSALQYIFSSPQGTANVIYWAIADASKDNVIYVEFRIAPYWLEPKSNKRFKLFVNALQLGIAAAARHFPNTIAKIILSVPRSVARRIPTADISAYYDQLIEVASQYRDMIVGFDLSGDEDEFSNKHFLEFARKVKTGSFKLTIHAGETDKPQAIWEAIQLLGADRIGHGIGARRDPSLRRYLAESGTPLELCPTSNWLLGIVPSLLEHPFGQFFQEGIRTTVNTDNPVLLANTTLSKEYYQLLSVGHISVTDISKLQAYSIDACFASEGEKRKLSSHFSPNLSGDYMPQLP